MLVFLSPLNYNNISEVVMTFLQLIESFLDPILSTEFGGILLSMVFIAVVVISFGIFQIPKNIILTSSFVLLLMFISFGWIPLWIVLLLTIILFVFLFMNLRGGSNA